MTRNDGVGLGSLKLLERVEIRVGVVEVHDEAHRDQVVAEVVNERPSARLVVERPAHRMLHQPRLMIPRRDFPKFLQADPELLRAAIFIQTVLLDELLGDGATRAFSKERVLAHERHARRVAIFVPAILRDAEITCDDALNRTILADDDISHRDSRINLDPDRLRLLPEPLRQIAEASGVASVIVHQRWHEEVRQADFSRFTKVVKHIFRDGIGKRRALLAPIGNERVEPDGIDNGARKYVGADLGPFFQDNDGQLLVLFCCELLEPDRSGQASRTPTHDHHIELHHVPFDLIAQISPFCLLSRTRPPPAIPASVAYLVLKSWLLS